MPMRPATPCTAPGCRYTTRTGSRCAAHRRADQRELDARRGSASSRGYGARHRDWRAAIIARDPLCVACLAVGRVTPTRVADHVLPVAQGGEWTMENGQGLCDRHHNVKRAHERQGRTLRVMEGQGLVVVGARRGKANA